MTSTINAANQSGYTDRARLNAYTQSQNEFKELQQEQLVGEDSRMSSLYDPTNQTMADIFQWSHSDNNRWQAYQQEGPAGQQAAQYLEQMVDQRRTLANDYMRQFNDLALHLNSQHQQPGEPGPDLDAMLDNAAAGRSPVVNADGNRMAQADALLAYWHQNQGTITSLQNSYKDLQEFPKQVSEWLDQNQIERPIEVDLVVEKYRYAGFNGLAETSAELVNTSAMRLDGKEATGIKAVSFQGTVRKMDEYGVYSQTDDGMVKVILDQFQQSGVALGMTGMEAQVLMDQENRQAWGQYKQLHGPLADTFNSEFSSPLEPRFTLQDIVDNLRAERPAAQLQDGSTHPEADRIGAFVTTHSATLNAVVLQQQALQEMPKTLDEWLQVPGNRHKAQMEVYERHGVEPWKQNNPIAELELRLRKASSALRATAEGMAAANSLRSRLSDLLNEKTHTVPFTLQQLTDNFRWGRALGTMEDDSQHPQAAMIEQVFSGTAVKKQLITYLLSDVHKDDTTTSNTKQYNPKESQAELLSLLNQGQAVLDDSILSSLLMSGKNNTSGN